MEYVQSHHYNVDPLEEVNAALTANSPESVQSTLEARLMVESRRRHLDQAAIDRVRGQLAYVTTVAAQVEVHL